MGCARSGTTVHEDGQWTMPGKDFAATRYSGLDQISASNARRLRPLWSFSTGVLGGHEGQPIVVGSTMYVVTPYPNVLYAFDLTKEGYPLRWKYRPYVNPAAIGIACCDLVNRGAVYAEGKIIYNLLDGHTVAIDTATGKEVWKTKVADLSVGESTPMAPLVAKDRVIVGTAGGEYGVRGWVKGLDLSTGRIVWTGYSIGSDADVLARPGTFKPFYQTGTELALESWPKTDGSKAVRRSGAGSRTTRSWTWCTTAPEIRRPGTQNSAPETTVGRRACSHAIPAMVRSCGRISSLRQITGTTIQPRK